MFDINKFIAYDNKSALNIIKNANTYGNNDKILLVVAGPNGSGKTTLISNLYQNNIINFDYLNADLFAIEKFSYILDENEKNMQSMFYTMKEVNNYINSGKSFCYETVLSHPSKIELVQNAKEQGFKIVSIFVYTKSPEINIERVGKRFLQGGHNVPKDKIISRYYRSIELSKKLKELSDEYYEFDNSLNKNIQKIK